MKLSIITINYNDAAGLETTMFSVLNQTANDFEYIIIDGGSSDGSKELIEQATNDKRLRYWVSEPDNGVYHAMNKGIKIAKGDFVQFLNSGDSLVNSTVIGDILQVIPDCDIFVGKRISIRQDGKKRVEPQKKNINLHTFYNSTIQHPASYIRRSLFETHGLYDESLKIASDWKWFLIVAGLNQAKVVFTDLELCYFDMTGISSTQLEMSKAERRKVLEELLPFSILDFFDKYHIYINQIERIKSYPIFYRLVSIIERFLFKMEKYKRDRWK